LLERPQPRPGAPHRARVGAASRRSVMPSGSAAVLQAAHGVAATKRWHRRASARPRRGHDFFSAAWRQVCVTPRANSVKLMFILSRHFLRHSTSRAGLHEPGSNDAAMRLGRRTRGRALTPRLVSSSSNVPSGGAGCGHAR
jgi:hypothetical protein